MIKHPFSSESIPAYIDYKRYWRDYENDISFFNNDGYHIKDIYPIIDNKVVHRCSKQSFSSIVRDGFIFPNSGQYEYTYPQSNNNLGIKKGWVCLFDFTALPHHICEQYRTWGKFFLQFPNETILLVMDKGKIDFVDNPFYSDNNREFCIPYVEIWSKKPIPLSSAEKYVLLTYSYGKAPIVADKIDDIIREIIR